MMTTPELTDRLISALDASVRKAVSGMKAGVAFSGGLDSGIVAELCGRYADVTLYTVGIRDAYDVGAAERMAEILGLPWRHIEISEDILEKELPEMIRMTGTVNPITLSFEVPLYFVLKNSSERLILSGQGADELFAGFSKYIGLTEEQLAGAAKDDMARLMNITLKHEHTVAEYFSKEVIYPYLDEKFVGVVNSIGISAVSEGEVRKPLLRDMARSLRRPELAERPKKAAQYGSGTMVAMRSMAKRKNMTVREMVSEMAGISDDGDRP
jgi:asparagine synthase (glutamine-hydrolysing)